MNIEIIRAISGSPFKILGGALFALTGIAGLIICLIILNDVLGFFGIVLGLFLFPFVIVAAPWYAAIAWGNSLPLIIIYGGGIISAILWGIGSALMQRGAGMDNTNWEEADFFEAFLAIQHDPDYMNEWVPAYYFEQNAERDLGLEVSDREKNDRDPPDYYFVVNGYRVGLEITSLLDDNLMERNAFFQRVEGIISKLTDEKKSVLPAGKYEIHFFPGEARNVAEGVKMDIPVWGREFKGKEYEPQISSSLDKLVEGFQGRHTTSPVLNKRGELIGTIHLSRLADCDEVDVFLWPQGARLIKEWTPEELQQALQGRIDAKDSKYEQEDLSIPNWLLISDTRSIMSTGGIEFDISSIKVKSTCFQRVFFIRGLETDYRISELQRIDV